MKTLNNYVTINKLVEKFQKFYPGVSASKIRFLESKGLISPKRSSGKYRIYDREDVVKLNFILKMQKEYYLPLEAIKEKLDTIEFKLNTEDSEIADQLKLDLFDSDYGYVSKYISYEDLKSKFNLDEQFLSDLIEGNILKIEEIDDKKIIKSSEIEILKIVLELFKYGIQVKNLHFFENFSSREASFIQQIVFPIIMSGAEDSLSKAEEIISNLEDLLFSFRKIMVKRENRQFLEKYR